MLASSHGVYRHQSHFLRLLQHTGWTHHCKVHYFVIFICSHDRRIQCASQDCEMLQKTRFDLSGPPFTDGGLHDAGGTRFQ